MPNSVPLSPMLTTNAAGSFRLQTEGYVQGVAMDDPAVRFFLASGTLGPAETLPMWGGVLISETVGGNLANSYTNTNGRIITRAATLAVATGFSVFNQSHAWISSPQSEVPVALNNMSVGFYRFGSGARIPVAIDPSLVSLEGGLITQQVSWDYNLQRLVPYAPVEAANNFTAMSWANTAGGTVTATTTTAHGYVAGDDITVQGVTPAAYNGDWTLATASGSTLTFLLPAATTPGTVTVQGQIAAGGGALNCRVLEINMSNSKTVNYDGVNNLAHWNNSGSTALILI
jgi:hypothetical protein